MQKIITVQTNAREVLYDITAKVKEAASVSGVNT